MKVSGTSEIYMNIRKVLNTDKYVGVTLVDMKEKHKIKIFAAVVFYIVHVQSSWKHIIFLDEPI